MCKNSENGANSDFQKVMRSSNGTGATHWRHAEGRRQRAEEFYESNVYELIVNCVTVCFLRAPQARGVTGIWPGKPSVRMKGGSAVAKGKVIM